jgi:hypothetical protein
MADRNSAISFLAESNSHDRFNLNPPDTFPGWVGSAPHGVRWPKVPAALSFMQVSESQEPGSAARLHSLSCFWGLGWTLNCQHRQLGAPMNFKKFRCDPGLKIRGICDSSLPCDSSSWHCTGHRWLLGASLAPPGCSRSFLDPMTVGLRSGYIPSGYVKIAIENGQ